MVVRDQNASVASGEIEDVRILQTSKARRDSGSEVNRRHTPNDGREDDLVEIGIRLKADRYQRASGVCFLASASFW